MTANDNHYLLLYNVNSTDEDDVNDLFYELKSQAEKSREFPPEGKKTEEEESPIRRVQDIKIPERIENNTVILSVDDSYFRFVLRLSGDAISGKIRYIIQLANPQNFDAFYNFFMEHYLPDHYFDETLDLSGLISIPIPEELKGGRNPFNFNFPPFCQTLSLVCYLFSELNQIQITQLMLMNDNLYNPTKENPLAGLESMMGCFPLYFSKLRRLYLGGNGIPLDRNYQNTIKRYKRLKFTDFDYNDIEYIVNEQISFISRETDLKQEFIYSELSKNPNLKNTSEIIRFLREHENQFQPDDYIVPEAYDLHHLDNTW